ncbi:hypothetical protein DCCM_3743 [Desulfocucumis palustris]|uniref:Uncharacterized protein n=1 Tax=Desulfocucumis palustris TaxID=1898651 RepID=A0A2L2XFY5_9FIRM|nr:hypothetical protein DCCM_3743 [Desulfocucumis palustris]
MSFVVFWSVDPQAVKTIQMRTAMAAKSDFFQGVFFLIAG